MPVSRTFAERFGKRRGNLFRNAVEEDLGALRKEI